MGTCEDEGVVGDCRKTRGAPNCQALKGDELGAARTSSEHPASVFLGTQAFLPASEQQCVVFASLSLWVVMILAGSRPFHTMGVSAD